MSRNALIKYYNTIQKKEQILHQIMEADNYESFLWEEDISNYKKYPIDEIAEEMLWLTPFKSNGLQVLIEYVEKRMTITKRIKWKREHTKPHRGDLRKAINRLFIKERSKVRQAKQQKKSDIELDIVLRNIQIAVNEFGMELLGIVYDKRVPKTDALYKEDREARVKTITLYKRQGDYELAKVISSKPLIPEPTYKEVAYSLKDQYLQKHSELPKQRLEKALNEMIKETNKYVYPTRKDKLPLE